MPRPTATDHRRRSRWRPASATRRLEAERRGRLGRRRRRSAGLRGEDDDSPDDQRCGRDAGQETGDDRDPGPHAGAEGTSTDGPRRASCGPRYDARPMAGPTEQIRTRVLPALLTAFGVTILAAGLLTYSVPVDGGAPVAPTGSPSPEPSTAVVPTPTPLITLPPIGTARPTPSEAAPTPPPDRVATRVRVADLDIDLAVVRGNTGYPYCNVAMYLPSLSQPGFGQATYLYAHAREGMFLPLCARRAATSAGSSSTCGPATTGSSSTASPRSAATRTSRTASPTRRPRRPSSSGCRHRRARTARSATPRSSPSRSDPGRRATPTANPRARPVVCG